MKKLKLSTVADVPKKEKKTQQLYLSVRTPFRIYERGALIREQREIDAILNCHEKSYVVRIHSITSES